MTNSIYDRFRPQSPLSQIISKATQVANGDPEGAVDAILGSNPQFRSMAGSGTYEQMCRNLCANDRVKATASRLGISTDQLLNMAGGR